MRGEKNEGMRKEERAVTTTAMAEATKEQRSEGHEGTPGDPDGTVRL